MLGAQCKHLPFSLGMALQRGELKTLHEVWAFKLRLYKFSIKITYLPLQNGSTLSLVPLQIFVELIGQLPFPPQVPVMLIFSYIHAITAN